MRRFFHVSTRKLAEGLVLEPGQFGRDIRAFRQGGSVVTNGSQAAILMWEAVLESVRQTNFSSLPSRLDCVFATHTTVEALLFGKDYRNNVSTGWNVFEIEVGDDVPIHVGNFSLISTPFDEPWVDHIVSKAGRYWGEWSPGEGMRELLIGGPVTVVREHNFHRPS